MENMITIITEYVELGYKVAYEKHGEAVLLCARLDGTLIATLGRIEDLISEEL